MAGSARRRQFQMRAARVAALIIVGMGLAAFAIYRVGLVFDVFAHRYELVTLLPSTMGLREGAPVTLAGKRIGQVRSIDLIPVYARRGENNIAIRLAISDDAGDQIRTDSRAFLRTQGLLGDKLVDIEPGSSGAAILEPGDTLDSGRSLDIESFLTLAASALDSANLVVGDLRNITSGISHGEGTIGRLLDDEKLYSRMVEATTTLQSALNLVSRAEGTLGRLLHDPALYQRIIGAVDRVDSLGAILLDGDGAIPRLLRSDSLYSSLLGSAASADTAMASLEALVQRMSTGQGSIHRLMTDPELYDQFLKAVIDLQTLIQAIRANPDRFKPNIEVRIF